ncbi:hypothetical protein FKP32DRAFT_255300 [Trametes sanguinea]|nr:hypothetical protein FKP32DRAFT_255300 [Trametes sanguinea]
MGRFAVRAGISLAPPANRRCPQKSSSREMAGSGPSLSPPTESGSSPLRATDARQIHQVATSWSSPPDSHNYPTLRLHDGLGRVVWLEHHERGIASLAFSEDCTRALAGNWEGEIFLYDLTQVVCPDQNAPPALQLELPCVPQYTLSSGSNLPLRRISFSPDGQGITTDRSYTLLDPPLAQPFSRHAESSPLIATCQCFLDREGWLWRVDPHSKPRRVCWLPSTLRPWDIPCNTTWSVQGDIIASSTNDRRLVLLDVSRCSC